jgi:beta-1,4-mannosyltransferase
VIIPWRRGISAAHLLDDGLSAITAANWATDQPPVAFIHWPVELANPYQRLLYSRFAGQNLVPIRLQKLAMIDSLLDMLPADMGKVLHVHWLYEVTAGAATEAEALAQVERFEMTISALRERGVRLLWTVHNVLPHETVFRAAEVRLRQFMLRTADVVHVMHDSHLGLLRTAFEVEPRAVIVLPHPSYAGAYPDWVDRASARSHLGIPLGVRVLVTFGQIRPYKGHSAFLDAFDLAARRNPQLRWLVAGKVRDEPGGGGFMRRASEHPAVLFYPGFTPEAEVQHFLRAADAAVYPYLNSLNSGALALTAGFDLPAYASLGTSVGSLMPAEAVTRFDPTDPEATARVLIEQEGILAEPARAAIRTHVRELHPAAISERFAREVRQYLVERPVLSRAS